MGEAKRRRETAFKDALTFEGELVLAIAKKTHAYAWEDAFWGAHPSHQQEEVQLVALRAAAIAVRTVQEQGRLTVTEQS